MDTKKALSRYRSLPNFLRPLNMQQIYLFYTLIVLSYKLYAFAILERNAVHCAIISLKS